MNEQLRAVNKQAAEPQESMKLTWEAMAQKLADKQPEPNIEAPEFDNVDEDDDPLFDSNRDYVTQIDSYKSFQNKPTARKVRTPKAKPMKAMKPAKPVKPMEVEVEMPPPPRPRFTRGN